MGAALTSGFARLGACLALVDVWPNRLLCGEEHVDSFQGDRTVDVEEVHGQLSPGRILLGQPFDQGGDIGADGRAAACVRVGLFLGHQPGGGASAGRWPE
jgi:hypothetical protein